MAFGHSRTRTCFGILVATLTSVGISAAAFAAGEGPNFIRDDRIQGIDQPATFVEDEFIVVLARGVRARVRVSADRLGGPTINLPSLQGVIARNAVVDFRRQFPTARPRAVGSKYPDLTGHYKVRIGAGAGLEAVIAAFAQNPHVDHVEKIGIHSVDVEANDPFFRDSPSASFPYDQWHYWDTYGVDAHRAWDLETGDASVVVAIADTGVRYFHSDLGGPDPPGPNDAVTDGNIWVNALEVPGNGRDDDNNGYVDDVVGYDFVNSTGGGRGCSCCDTDCGTKDNDPRDDNGHGTHLAGTVAAVTNNSRLVAGVAGGFSAGSPTDPADGVKVMALRIGWNAKCFGQCGYGFVRMDYAAEAMNYVSEQVERGVNVTAFNASWGSSNSGGIDAAVDNLLAHDVMLMHAAGNADSDSPGYLGNKAGVMNVAATGQNGNGASFTNYGSWVDVAAPGVKVVSTYHYFPDPANDYIALLSGTSMSAPHACGVAALLESCAPSLTRTDKFNLMVANVLNYFDSRDLGSGILNAKFALDAAGCSGIPGCAADGDCDDGDACNGAETCDVGTGACQAGTPVNCDDSNACTTDSCDPATGLCSNDAINCDDGNACTADSCDPATGCANDPVNCDDSNACTTDSCDPATGLCSNDAINCNDGNACTADSCDPATGCANDPVTACVDADGCCPTGCDSGNDLDCSGTICGNGVCEGGGEDCFTCVEDCDGSGKNNSKSCCGNGTCEGNKEVNNCPIDCGF